MILTSILIFMLIWICIGFAALQRKQRQEKTIVNMFANIHNPFISGFYTSCYFMALGPFAFFK